MGPPGASGRAQTVISISIVSHGQGELVAAALADLSRFSDSARFEVILTKNVPERLPFAPAECRYAVKLVENPAPKGFGANHNGAFRVSEGDFFCVMNPDVRMASEPFPRLLGDLEARRAALIAPAVVSATGRIEDTIRRFPTPLSLAGKLLGRGDGRYRFALGDDSFAAEWVAGMFMLFRADDFRRVNGFDEGFYLYYEDVDICARLWKSGRPVLACPQAQVVHEARRSSRQSLRYMRWHACSMARYFGKHWFRLPRQANP